MRPTRMIIVILQSIIFLSSNLGAVIPAGMAPAPASTG